MTSIDVRPFFNAASASAIAFLLYGAAPVSAEPKEQPKAAASRYTTKTTSPSLGGSIIVTQAFDSNHFQKEVTAFYAKLSDRQTDLEPALQHLLLANISSLYED